MSYTRDPVYAYVSSGADGDEVLIVHPNEIPVETFDELVVMRLAEMSDAEREAAEARAVERHAGNCGSNALCKKRGLPGWLDGILPPAGHRES